VAVSRQAYAAVGGFGPFQLGEDSEFQARIALAFPVAASTRTTAVYVVGGGGVSERSVRRWADLPLRSVAELSPAVALVVERRAGLGDSALARGLDAYIDSYVSICLRVSASIADVKTIRKMWRLYTGGPPLVDFPFLALGLLPRRSVHRVVGMLKRIRHLARATRRRLIRGDRS
jgi:hypothetical protein